MESDLFCVKWTPPIENFSKYIIEFRKATRIPLGGTRTTSHHYRDSTVSRVLSVGPQDSLSSLPQRISLSNFKLEEPITSYGCIYRSATDKVRYLLIQRKNSVGYVDFIRGCYRESQLFFMIQDFPLIERERLLKYDFETLWLDFHLKSTESDAYEHAKGVFTKIAPHLKRLFELIPPADPEGKNLWLFPKGKLNWMYEDDDDLFSSEEKPKNVPETPFDCALREFREETNGLEIRESGKLVFVHPVVECYLGSNSKNYQTNYFVYQTSESPEINQFERKRTPIREISSGEVERVIWVEIEELPKYLRPERLELIRYIERNLPQTQFPYEVDIVWRSSLESSEENK